MANGRLFDLHSDTLGVCFSVSEDGETIPFEAAKHELWKRTAPISAVFPTYHQVFAVYSRPTLPPQVAWERLVQIATALHTLPLPLGCRPYLAVENGALLDERPERLERLPALGVRVFTPLWGGKSCLGGAHDTAEGLTPFGIEAVRYCLAHGILVDVSHASDTAFWQILTLADEEGLPPIASHSSARALCPHSRNLTDDMFHALRRRGGIVGVCLAPEHLSPSGQATVATVADHVEYYFSLGGERCVCLGCDYDGIEQTPRELECPARLPALAAELQRRGLSPTQIENCFYGNASSFFMKNGVRPSV